jgi:tetratricopeptide (TPR) repeat protein
MALDKNKLAAEATKLVQKSQWDKALKIYEKILAEDPKDVRVLLKIGELQQKKNDAPAAAETLHKVGQAYTDQGFFLKAVAVYKQIVKLAPGDVRVNERLAALYQQLGIVSDAMQQLQAVAQAADAAGDEKRLLEVLGRMVELDPENPAAAMRLGELHAKAGATAQALEHFRRAADVLRRGNRGDDWIRAAERVAALDPSAHALTRELANAYLGRGDTKRALAKLQLCFKADPNDVETLALLATAFRDLGQTSKTISVYKELARLEAERGRAAEARAAWRRVAELAPEDPDAVEALGAEAAQHAAANPAPAPVAVPQAQAAAPAAPAARGPAVARPPPEAIPKLLQEMEVFAKYGLVKKALEHLEKVFAADPRHVEALERARDLQASSGNAALAADYGARAVEAAHEQGDARRAEEGLARLRQLAPGDARLAALDAKLHGGGDDVVFEAAPAADDDDGAAEELELELAPDEDTALEEVEIDAAEAMELDAEDVDLDAGEEVSIEPGAPAPLPPAASRPAPARDDEMSFADVDAELRGAAPPPPSAFRAPPEPPAEPDAALVVGVDDAQLLDELPPPDDAEAAAAEAALDLEGAPLVPGASEPVGAEGPIHGAMLAGPGASADPGLEAAPDLSPELAEIDFFVQQGLEAEAREALAGLVALHPGHPALLERQRALAAPRPPPRPPAIAEEEEGTFDLARELADELEGFDEPAPEAAEGAYPVANVLDAYRGGIQTHVAVEDGATHFDLGIAYKEMGLLDDAIHEFEVARESQPPKPAVDCFTMIGLCRFEKEDLPGAVEAFRRALAAGDAQPEAARALHYELGRAHEALGDAEGALWYFQKVVRADPRFRDARARVEALGSGPGRPPAGDPDAAAADAGAPRKPAKRVGYV